MITGQRRNLYPHLKGKVEIVENQKRKPLSTKALFRFIVVDSVVQIENHLRGLPQLPVIYRKASG